LGALEGVKVDSARSVTSGLTDGVAQRMARSPEPPREPCCTLRRYRPVRNRTRARSRQRESRSLV